VLYNVLKEIYFCLDNGDRRVMDAYNLSVPRYYALKNIGENPGISLTHLSDLMLSDKSNITRLVKSIEDDGLVTRKPREGDRRSMSLYLTKRGQELLQKASAAHQAFIRDRFSEASVDIPLLLEQLSTLKRNLEQQLEQNWPGQ